MDRRNSKKDPTVWRAKVLALYRTILHLRNENKHLSREVTRLKRKIESMEKWEKRKAKFVEWLRKIFGIKKNG